MFNGSVFENVAYGLAGTEHVNASKEEQLDRVIKACKAAYAHDFIERLPEVGDKLRVTNVKKLTSASEIRYSGRRASHYVIRRPEAAHRHRPQYCF